MEKIETVVRKMRYTEKLLFFAFFLIAAISGLVLLFRVNNSFLVEVPAFGGKFTEGLVGSPRFINPVLAISDTDKDLSSLIYSGLLKTSENGGAEADLAESYEIQENGIVYYVKIRSDVFFHDGKKVTADDVVFTIQKILDPVIKSPKQASWESVLVEKISEQEIKFTLKKPYSPFLESLTLGILPKHIWEKVSSEEFAFSDFNIDPIGSGPYKIEKIIKNSGGIPSTITLSAWKKYSLGKPKIRSITLKFFSNDRELAKAYRDRSVESAIGLSPSAITENGLSKEAGSIASLPRVFGIFFNQNTAPVFTNQEVREALEMAAPKQKIVDEALLGFGSVLNGPTPENVEADTQKATGNVEEAKALLTAAGWKANDEGVLTKKTKNNAFLLAFSISTSDTPELKKTAEILKEAWEQLGAQVSIKIFEAGDLSQNVIRPRKYDSLLFGEIVGAQSDLYSFWHSSERNDPGLNIALYANITVDKVLEELRAESDVSSRDQKKETLFSEIRKDIPAIFLFSPHLVYFKAPEVKNVLLKDVSTPNERFLSVNKWFIETDKVWKIFADQQESS